MSLHCSVEKMALLTDDMPPFLFAPGLPGVMETEVSRSRRKQIRVRPISSRDEFLRPKMALSAGVTCSQTVVPPRAAAVRAPRSVKPLRRRRLRMQCNPCNAFVQPLRGHRSGGRGGTQWTPERPLPSAADECRFCAYCGEPALFREKLLSRMDAAPASAPVSAFSGSVPPIPAGRPRSCQALDRPVIGARFASGGRLPCRSRALAVSAGRRSLGKKIKRERKLARFADTDVTTRTALDGAFCFRMTAGVPE
ncbi:hypothetical protein MRX96_029330 [Rhipicephalus microplus]